MSVATPRKRRAVRHELQRGIDDLAARAREDGRGERVQVIIEVCPAESYRRWRQTRELRWRKERSGYDTRAWPERIEPLTIAAVLLPQAHGGSYRGRPAEIGMPLFSHGQPASPGRDFEHPYEPMVLRLALGWVRLAIDAPDQSNGILLATPLVDLITIRPGSRIAHELGVSWPLEASEPHINPPRQRA